MSTVTSATIGQVLHIVAGVPLVTLFYISLVTYACAGATMLIIPSVSKKAEKLHWKDMKLLLKDVGKTYKVHTVLKWSIWGGKDAYMKQLTSHSGLSLAIHHLVLTYWQSLFLEINKEASESYNGYVSASAYLLAACCALLPAKIEHLIPRLTSALLVASSIIDGLLLLVMSRNNHVLLSYCIFILYHCLFEFMWTIVNVQIAKHMPNFRFGLIFSINTSAAMLFQTIIQFTVGSIALKLDIREQFIFFGSCLLALGVLYGSFFAFLWIRDQSKQAQQTGERLLGTEEVPTA